MPSLLAAHGVACGPCSALQQARSSHSLELCKIWTCHQREAGVNKPTLHARASGTASCQHQLGRSLRVSQAPAVKPSADTAIADSVRRPLVLLCSAGHAQAPGRSGCPAARSTLQRAASCRTLNTCSGAALQPDVHPCASDHCALTASFQQGGSRLCRAQADCGAAQSSPDRQVRLTHMAVTSRHPATYYVPAVLMPRRCFTKPLWPCSACRE